MKKLLIRLFAIDSTSGYLKDNKKCITYHCKIGKYKFDITSNWCFANMEPTTIYF